MSMPDFKFDTQTRFPAVTKDEYRRRAKIVVDESRFSAPQLLGMLEAFFRGQGPDVAATHIERARPTAITEYHRIKQGMTQRDYIPQAAQIELLAELRDRVKS